MGAKRLPACCLGREDAELALERRLCCEVWFRRAGFGTVLAFVGRRGASVKGSCVEREGGMLKVCVRVSMTLDFAQLRCERNRKPNSLVDTYVVYRMERMGSACSIDEWPRNSTFCKEMHTGCSNGPIFEFRGWEWSRYLLRFAWSRRVAAAHRTLVPLRGTWQGNRQGTKR